MTQFERPGENIFDHITGKLTHYDLLYSLPLAEFDKSEYDYAFNNGWLPCLGIIQR